MESTHELNTVELRAVSTTNTLESTSSVAQPLRSAEDDAYTILLTPNVEINSYGRQPEPSGTGAAHEQEFIAREEHNLDDVEQLETKPTVFLAPVPLAVTPPPQQQNSTITTATVSKTEPSAEPGGGGPGQHCLLCNCSAAGGTYRLFDSSLVTSGSQSTLAGTLQKALGRQLRPRQLHSELICSACFHLTDRLDQLATELRQVRSAIQRLYWQTAQLYPDTPAQPPLSETPPLPLAAPALTEEAPPTPVKRGPGRPPLAKNKEKLEAARAAKAAKAAKKEATASRQQGVVPPRSQRAAARRAAGQVRRLAEAAPEPELEATPILVASAEEQSTVAAGDDSAPLDVDFDIIDDQEPPVADVDVEVHVEKKPKKKRVRSKDKSENRLMCQLCGKTFQRPVRLQDHITAVHTGGGARYVCHLCERPFTQKYYLNEHIRQIHEQRSVHTCEMCGKTFLRAMHLADHMRTHSGDKPFVCTVCGKGFTQRGNLRQHALLHTDVYPYQCDACGRRFHTRATMILHQNSKHSDEKPFQCDLCSEAFKFKRSLDRHMRKHTGDRPFKCSICDKAFRDSSDLRSHAVTHSEERAFSCPVCQLAFSRKYKMLQHMKSKHDASEQQVQKISDLYKTPRVVNKMPDAVSENGQTEMAPAACAAVFSTAGSQDQPSDLGSPVTSVAGQSHPAAVRSARPSNHDNVVMMQSPDYENAGHESLLARAADRLDPHIEGRTAKHRKSQALAGRRLEAEFAGGQFTALLAAPERPPLASERPVQVVLDPDTSLQSMQARLYPALLERRQTQLIQPAATAAATDQPLETRYDAASDRPPIQLRFNPNERLLPARLLEPAAAAGVAPAEARFQQMSTMSLPPGHPHATR